MPEEQELYSIDRIDIGTGLVCFKAGGPIPISLASRGLSSQNVT